MATFVKKGVGHLSLLLVAYLPTHANGRDSNPNGTGCTTLVVFDGHTFCGRLLQYLEACKEVAGSGLIMGIGRNVATLKTWLGRKHLSLLTSSTEALTQRRAEEDIRAIPYFPDLAKFVQFLHGAQINPHTLMF